VKGHVFITCFFLLLISSCDSRNVKQISVEVPTGIIVPAGMAYIPAGEFIMGDAEELETQGGKLVKTGAFLIDLYEVSHEDYKKLKPEHSFHPKRARWPVALVTYVDAESFCQAEGKRLPSEKEWEKAARGTDGRIWPWKIYIDHPNNGFSGFMSEPVDKRQDWISPYGVYGMGHNVWEWMTDDFTPIGREEKFKILRGGLLQSHLTIKFSPAWFRNWMNPDVKLNFIGFRCAKDV
jgi:formylglycine-generating enzyme required for sulfatase activity